MNIYQHLFIVIPSLVLIIYGFLGRNDTLSLWSVIIGILSLAAYLLYFVISWGLLIFDALGRI
jgi:hypothetical protein